MHVLVYFLSWLAKLAILATKEFMVLADDPVQVLQVLAAATLK